MTQNSGEPKATVIQKIETTHKAVETVSTAISIGSGILGFIRSIGGLGQFLVEVGELDVRVRRVARGAWNSLGTDSKNMTPARYC